MEPETTNNETTNNRHNNSENPFIEVSELTHTFQDGTQALRGINFSLGRGEFILMVGPNGSGKTVFARHLNALYRPTSGEVIVAGVSTKKSPSLARRRVGLVFQDADSQIVGQTVRDDIAFGPQNLRLPKEEIEARVENSLDLLNLRPLADHRPHLLSGGEKRRLAIAGVLALRPEVLVLDEPFSNLDYGGVVSVLEHVVSLHKKGVALVLVSHDIEKACAHADRLVVFFRGRIVEDGAPSDIIHHLPTYGVRVPPAVPQSPERSTWLS
ncbi:MAG: ATP-binding cassette domain-containing protein [Spirochaetia bacterium]